MPVIVDGELHLAVNHEQHAFGTRVEFGPLAASARSDLDDVLREGLGEARQRPRNHPQSGVVPKGKVAGDDVAHHSAGQHRVRLGEHSPVGEQLSLGRMSSRRCVVTAFVRCRIGPLLWVGPRSSADSHCYSFHLFPDA
jgi:hypothetical protein